MKKIAVSIIEMVLLVAVVTAITVVVSNKFSSQIFSLGVKNMTVTPRSNN
ncbi:MAG: hypothetical protein MJ229_00735 [bacterium]|nr:hypothetical protein [bacterium]